MTNSEIKCEHKHTIVTDNALSEWCEDCGAFREKSKNPWKWGGWYFPRTPEPTKAENGLEVDKSILLGRLGLIYTMPEHSHKVLDSRLMVDISDMVIKWLGAPSITKEYKRNQPCGCVMCVCEDEEQCHGCGAKSCANWKEEGHREKYIHKDESINITKDQLLAILPEKKHADHSTSDEMCLMGYGFNCAVGEIEELIKEMFK